MLYALADWLSNWFTPLNAFTYLTSRVIFGALTALLLSIGFGGRMIALLRRLQMGQYVRDDGPQTHLKKAGTPTMGGALIILSVCIAMLLWADLRVKYTWIALFVMLGFGVVGWIDDYRKLILKDPQGLRAKHKYALLSLVSLFTCIWLYASAASPVETTLYVPFFKNLSWQMGWLFLPFVYFVLTGASNAVNLTDGLDGLAIMPVVLVAGGLAVFAYISELSAPAGVARRRRNGGVLRGHCGRGSRFSLVQRASGAGLHGRRRRALARRGACHRGRRHPSRTGFRADERHLRRGSAFRDDTGGVVQDARQAGFPHGAAAPPF